MSSNKLTKIAYDVYLGLVVIVVSLGCLALWIAIGILILAFWVPLFILTLGMGRLSFGRRSVT